MVNDIIADSITRIRNAYTRRKKDTVLLYSKIIEKSLEILKEKKYIENFKTITIKGKKFLKVVLTYEDETSPINEMMWSCSCFPHGTKCQTSYRSLPVIFVYTFNNTKKIINLIKHWKLKRRVR